MAGKQRRRSQVDGKTQNDMADLIDDLNEFEEFKKSLLPALKAMVQRKAPPEEILATVQSLAAAKLGTMIVRSDTKHTMAAIQEVLNRTIGKPTEKVETTHRFEKMKDEELDSLLKSRLKEVSDTDGDSTEH